MANREVVYKIKVASDVSGATAGLNKVQDKLKTFDTAVANSVKGIGLATTQKPSTTGNPGVDFELAKKNLATFTASLEAARGIVSGLAGDSNNLAPKTVNTLNQSGMDADKSDFSRSSYADGLQKSTSDASSKLFAADEKLAALLQKIVTLNDKINSGGEKQNSLDSYAKKLATLETRATNAKSKIAALSSADGSPDATKLEKYKATLATAEAQIVKTKASIKKLSDDKSSPSAKEVEAYEKSLVTTEKQVASTREKIKSLQDTISSNADKLNNRVVNDSYAEQKNLIRDLDTVTGDFGDKVVASNKQQQDAIDNVDKAYKKVHTSVGNMAKAAQKSVMNVSNSLRFFTQGISEISRVLTFSVAVPLAAAFKTGGSSAIDFDEQLAKVRKTTGQTAEAVKELGDWILEIGKYTISTPTELGGFAEQLGQAGVRDENAIKRLIVLSDQLASATNISASDITLSIARIATAFGYDLNTETGVKSMERFSNVVNRLENDTAASASEIVTAVQNAASVGGLLDVPIQDLAALSASLISMGVSADSAGTILSRWYVQVIKNADKLSQMLAGFVSSNGKLYTSAQDVLDGINSDPVQVLVDSIDALNSVTDSQRAEALSQFFDTAGLIGGKLGVLAGGYKSTLAAMKSAHAEWENGTSLLVEYNIAQMTAASHLTILKNNLSIAADEIGSSILPTLNSLVEYAIPAIQQLTAVFGALDDRTKLLIVAGPIIAAALLPVLYVLAQMAHGLTLVGMGISSAIGFIGSFVGVLFSTGTAITAVFMKALLAAVPLTTAFGKGISLLSGTLISFGGALMSIVGGGLALFGILKLLNGLGVNVSAFFKNLSTRAANWGENLMVTYANGLAKGAGLVAKAVSKIAAYIAGFFESHSPPEDGPLSTIDKWGSNLLNTYMQGFELADFGILSNIAGKIKTILSNIYPDDSAGVSSMVGSAKTALSKLIAAFNNTGTISATVLSEIIKNIGSIGSDVKDLITYWLEYNEIQRRINSLENDKKTTLKNYAKEVALISASAMSAEDKAAAIRQAMMDRDTELRITEEQLAVENEASDTAKDKLDWQEAYVDAQIDELDLLQEITNAVSSLSTALSSLDYSSASGSMAASSGDDDPVAEFTKKITELETRIGSAREKIDSFFRGLKGEGFSDQSSKDQNMQYEEGDLAKLKNVYEMGNKLRSVYEGIGKMFASGSDGIATFIGILGDSMSGGFLGGFIDTFVNTFVDAGWGERLSLTLSSLSDSWTRFLDILGFTGDAAGLIKSALNVIGTALGWLVGAIGIVIATAVGFIVYIVGIIADIVMIIVQTDTNIVRAIIDLVDNIKNGLRDGLQFHDFGDIIRGWKDSFVNIFKKLFGIHSPSTVLEELGGFLVAGLVEGIKLLPQRATEGLDSMLTAVTSWISEKAAGIGEVISSIWGGAKNLFGGGKDTTTSGAVSTMSIGDIMGITPDSFAEFQAWLVDEKFPEIASWFAELPAIISSQLNFWGNLAEIFDRLWGSMTSWKQAKWIVWRAWWVELATAAGTVFLTFWETYLMPRFQSVWIQILLWFAVITPGWIASFRGLVDRAAEIMGTVGSNIGGAIRAAIPSVVAAIEDMVSAAKRAWADFPGIPGGGTLTATVSSGKINTPEGMASGGIVTRATQTVVGEGGEPEAVIPLSKLPAMVSSIFSTSGADYSSGGGITVQINNPVVRNDTDIREIARQVERVLSKQAANTKRMGI